MFTKGSNSIVLKKSGEIIDNVGKISSVIKIGNTTGATKLNALDLAISGVKEEKYLLDYNATTTVTIKNIVTGEVQPMIVNRTLASYSKIDKKYPIY
jgi:hypothetical protein